MNWKDSKRTIASAAGVLGRTSRRARIDGKGPYESSDVGPECQTRMGSDMASVDGDDSAAIDHRPPCLWKSLAAP